MLLIKDNGSDDRDLFKLELIKNSPARQGEAKVALAAVQEQESAAEIARRYKLRANLVYKWKRQLLDDAARAFEADGGDDRRTEREAELLEKIGELTVGCDFLSNGLRRFR